MKKTFEFTEQEAELLRKEQYKYLINDNIDHFLLLVQQIVSERITPEPGESGQSADEIIRHYCYHEDPLSPVLVITKDHALQAMTTYASQVCADKDARIKELEGLLSSDSVYGLFRFAYKSPESAQVYEISKKLRELKTK